MLIKLFFPQKYSRTWKKYNNSLFIVSIVFQQNIPARGKNITRVYVLFIEKDRKSFSFLSKTRNP